MDVSSMGEVTSKAGGKHGRQLLSDSRLASCAASPRQTQTCSVATTNAESPVGRSAVTAVSQRWRKPRTLGARSVANPGQSTAQRGHRRVGSSCRARREAALLLCLWHAGGKLSRGAHTAKQPGLHAPPRKLGRHCRLCCHGCCAGGSDRLRCRRGCCAGSCHRLCCCHGCHGGHSNRHGSHQGLRCHRWCAGRCSWLWPWRGCRGGRHRLWCRWHCCPGGGSRLCNSRSASNCSWHRCWCHGRRRLLRSHRSSRSCSGRHSSGQQSSALGFGCHQRSCLGGKLDFWCWGRATRQARARA